MKTRSKILFALASLSLLMLFVFPMWKIVLHAPQYPDGLTMYIWINDITGDSEGTLQNINIMNHYVGMKEIHVAGFPELSWIQYVVIAMIVIGLGMAFLGKKNLYLVWVITLFILSALGVYDFYLWEYGYGHNLKPNAAIVFEGMAYQPPLIGSKKMLNFLVYSWPWIGGWFIGGSIIMGFLSYWLLRKKNSVAL